MGIKIQIIYEGKLRTRLIHEPSAVEFFTEAPIDNGGNGQSFSPTDMVAGALASCMLTLIGISANKLQLNLEGSSAIVIKEMTCAPLRKIARLQVKISVRGKDLTPEIKVQLEKAALTCPVKESLHPNIDLIVDFDYPAPVYSQFP